MEINKYLSVNRFLLLGFVTGLIFFFNSGSITGYVIGVVYAILLSWVLAKTFLGKGKSNYFILFVFLLLGSILFRLNGTRQVTFEKNIFTGECRRFPGSAHTLWYYKEDPLCWCKITGAEYSQIFDSEILDLENFEGDSRVRCDELEEYLLQRPIPR